MHREADIENAVQLLRAEYAELPGLSLTPVQVERLLDIDRRTAEAVLGALVDARFLRRRPDGRYVRMPAHHSAKHRAN